MKITYYHIEKGTGHETEVSRKAVIAGTERSGYYKRGTVLRIERDFKMDGREAGVRLPTDFAIWEIRAEISEAPRAQDRFFPSSQLGL